MKTKEQNLARLRSVVRIALTFKISHRFKNDEYNIRHRSRKVIDCVPNDVVIYWGKWVNVPVR